MLTIWLAFDKKTGLCAKLQILNNSSLQSDLSHIWSLAQNEALMEIISSQAGPCDESSMTEFDMRVD